MPPLVIAHRGASGYRPEHTLEAYELAIEMGADFIEPDLVITRDGVLVARHESELSRTTDVAGHPEFADRRTTRRIDGLEATGWFTEDFLLEEIKTLRTRERHPFRDHSRDGRFQLATFEEILDLAIRRSAEVGRTIGVYPETKHPSYFRSRGLPLEEPLLAALEKVGWTGRDAPVFLQSFETGNLRDLRSRTGVRLIQLLDVEGQPWDLVSLGDSRSYQALATPEGLAWIATYADGIGPNKRLIMPVDADGRLLSPTSLVEDAHQAGLQVHPWTLRSDPQFLAAGYDRPEREYEMFYGLGVDGLFSDFPDLAVQVRRTLSSS